MKGRKPIPSKIKALRGHPDKRPRAAKGEPAPAAGLPDCPKHLSFEAKGEWARITDQLAACGLVTKIDRAALAAYCQAWGRWIKAEGELKKTGLVVKTTAGNVIQNPYLSIANKAMESMHKFLAEFGMTPSSRSRIRIAGPQHEDKLEKLLRVHKGA